MPEAPEPKAHPHPWKQGDKLTSDPPSLRRFVASSLSSPYTELAVTTNFTFLTGASHPEELIRRAADLGYGAIATTDTHSLAGIVRAHVAAKETGIQLVVGCRLVFASDPSSPSSLRRRACPEFFGVASSLSVLTYPTDRAAYGRMCRLLTVGKRRAPKGQCHLHLHDLIEHQEGLLAVVIPPARLDQDLIDVLLGLKRVFDDDRLSIAASCLYDHDDRGRLGQLAALSQHVSVPLVATNDVHYHHPSRRPLQDVLTCIRHGCTLDEAGLRLHPNAERHLKAPEEMARLFAEYPHTLARSAAIAERVCAFSLDQLRYEYPPASCPPDQTPTEYLADLTRCGARHRYPHGVPAKVRNQIEHELRLIEELSYAPYFLTVHDLVVFARGRGILCQGRGAAANSAVCYCLGITAVDPDRIDVLFERFVSRERNEPPDIDIDFEHERREEVIQYIYQTYGRDRAALTAEVITYRARSAVREVGKALSLSLDCIDRLAKDLDWWDNDLPDHHLRGLGLNPADPTIHRLIALAKTIQGFPRHLSQHVGGFVISRGPLCEVVPIENAAMPDRTIIEWDKDDIEAMGMLKVDVLGLGMLTCIRKALGIINEKHEGTCQLHSIPPEDPEVYDMICRADTVGVFQIESRAQMSMLLRLRPRCYYDLVIEVAIVRPGPIQGQMVHPYLRRRNGEEPVTYPHDEIQKVLGKTLGVPLFQEQVMALAVVAAGFTAGEADQLRRAIAAWKSRDPSHILRFRHRLIDGMLEHRLPREFAERCFEQIKGFGDYGFPESHAASFALLVYVSAWLKKYHPAAFAAALINSQPMGFYAPDQIVRDAREHGVRVRPIDVNHSEWDCGLEESDPPRRATRNGGKIEQQSDAREGEGRITESSWPGVEVQGCDGANEPVLRLGMRLVKGLRQDEAEMITETVAHHGPFDSIESLRHTSRVRKTTLRKLAQADAFSSMGLDRQHALWTIRALHDTELPLYDSATVSSPSPLCASNSTGVSPRVSSPPSSLRRGACPPRRVASSLSSLPSLPPIPCPTKVLQDYRSLGLSLRPHPLSFLRDDLNKRGVLPAIQLKDEQSCPHGAELSVAGLVLVRQRPGTASGIIFMTLEDETAMANLIVRPHIYQRYRRTARHGVIVLARGRIERQGEVVHLLVRSVKNLTHELAQLAATSRNFR